MPRLATRCICCDATPLDRQGAVLMPFVAERALGWQACEITAEWGLRSIPTGWAHALCTSLHCPACGCLFLDMRFDGDEMARLYAGYRGPDYEAQRERLEPGYAAHNRRLLAGDEHIPAVETFLRPWLPPRPAVLDWGGDTGLNTPLRQAATRHDVLDISGRPLVAGATAVSAPQGPYDLIVLAHVLEHVPEPDALLREVGAAMTENTWLYVEVPLEALMQAAEMEPAAWRRKRHWHEHINFFSAEGLRRLLQRCGLRVQAETRLTLSGQAAALGLLCRR